MLGERRNWTNWPRIRRHRGEIRISGRCVTVGRWLAVRRATFALLLIVALTLLLSSQQGLWLDWTVGTPLYRPAVGFAGIRVVAAELLVRRYPEIGNAIGYTLGPIDWHMLALSVLLVLLHRPIVSAAGWLLSLPLAVGFVARISRDRVIVRAGLRRFRFDRRSGEVVVRLVPPGEYFADRAEKRVQKWSLLHRHIPTALVECAQRNRRSRLLFARRLDRAEAIVVACNEALLRTGRGGFLIR